MRDSDLKTGYHDAPAIAEYGDTTVRKVNLFRRHGLLKAIKFGKKYVFRKEWFDAFAEQYAGYDLSSEEKIIQAKAEHDYRVKHGLN